MIKVLRDSIALIYRVDFKKYFYTLINLKNGKTLQNIFQRGRGSYEFVEGLSLLKNDFDYSTENTIEVIDHNAKRILTYHLDSLLKYGVATAPIATLKYQSKIGENAIGTLNDKDYVCYNPYYMSYGDYTNKDEPALFKTNQSLEERGSVNDDPKKPKKYNTTIVSQCALYTHPKHPYIVLVEERAGHIRLYDKKNLSLKKEVIAPDSKLPKLKLNAEMWFINRPKTTIISLSNIDNAVSFRKGKDPLYYDIIGCQTDDFIYLFYQHGGIYTPKRDENEDADGKPYKTTLFKMDWEGNPIACYHLDTPVIDDISISQDGKTLYGNTWGKKAADGILLKYDLP